jgi:hypothetical protein
MAQHDPNLKLRIPPDLKSRLHESAKENKRSMNAEATYRLESTFAKSVVTDPVTDLNEIIDRANALLKLFEED